MFCWRDEVELLGMQATQILLTVESTLIAMVLVFTLSHLSTNPECLMEEKCELNESGQVFSTGLTEVKRAFSIFYRRILSASPTIFRCASISSTYPCLSVGR